MKYKDVVKLIEEDGWNQARQKGSHRAYKHQTKPTLNIILKQAGLK